MRDLSLLQIYINSSLEFRLSILTPPHPPIGLCTPTLIALRFQPAPIALYGLAASDSVYTHVSCSRDDGLIPQCTMTFRVDQH